MITGGDIVIYRNAVLKNAFSKIKRCSGDYIILYYIILNFVKVYINIIWNGVERF